MLPPVRLLEGAALPGRLADLESPPHRLYLHGELPRGAAVAIVGTRKPTRAARRYTRQLAAELAQQGVVIVSGGAEGIDRAAHDGALDACGVTVVVAPAGFDAPYPSDHAPLFRRVVSRGGAYLSELSPSSPAFYSSFLARNRVLAALSHVVIVVEAGFRSGARNAAKQARTLGRSLFVVPGVPWNPRSHGCLEELRLGARAFCSAREILAALEAQRAHWLAVPTPTTRPRSGRGSKGRKNSGQLQLLAAPPSGSAAPPLGSQPESKQKPKEIAINSTSCEARQRLVETLAAGPAYADELARLLGLEAAATQQLLLTLRLDGVLVADSAGRWMLSTAGNDWI